MSVVVDLAVLSEGAATDARGNITLVGVNPQIFIVDEYPAQFSPFFLVALKEDDESSELVPNATVSARVEVTGPDGEVLLVVPIPGQQIAPPPYPVLRPRVQIAGQVPFSASKTGTYTVSAFITITGADGQSLGVVKAPRSVTITDRAALKAKSE